MMMMMTTTTWWKNEIQILIIYAIFLIGNVESVDKHLEVRRKTLDYRDTVAENGVVAKKYDKRFLFSGPTISEKCREDMQTANDYEEMFQRTYSPTPLWRNHMFDAFWSIPSGLTEGYVVWAGDILGCTKLKVWKNTTDVVDREPDIKGKYCLGTVGVVVIGTPLKAAVCVPDSCTAIEAQIATSMRLFPFRIYLEEDFCQTDVPKPMDKWTQLIMIIFGIVGGFVLIATIYDIQQRLRARLLERWQRTYSMDINIIRKHQEKTKHAFISKCVLAFSAWTNTIKLMDTTSATEAQLRSIHGMKAITMSWVVTGHMFVMINQFFEWKNAAVGLQYLKGFWFQSVGSAEFSVDTFITITGFLLVYVVVRESKKYGGTFNILVFYINRIVRLTPSFALIIAVMCGPLPHYAKGVFVPASFLDQAVCRKVWWKALLYIQSYIQEPEKCLPQIWYLCIDMAYYLVAPIFLYPLVKKPRVGYVLLTVLLVATTLLPALLIHYHDLGAFPAFNISYEKREQYMNEVYNAPWGRMHAFIIGALFGCFYIEKGKTLKLKRWFVAFMWLAVTATMLTLVYAMLPYSSGEKEMKHTRMVLYGAFTRPAWAVGIAWIVLACATGYGGVINQILSWKGFIPLSRLSYGVYLSHFTIIGQMVAARKEPQFIDYYYMIYATMAVISVTTIFAWLMALMAEIPSISIEKQILEALGLIVPHSHQMPTTSTQIINANRGQNEPLIVPIRRDQNVDSESEVYWDSRDSQSIRSDYSDVEDSFYDKTKSKRI